MKPPPHDGNTVIIWHRRCLDGFAAAWAAHRRYPGATLIDANYQEPIPTPEMISGKHVIVVDFSYDREDLLDLERQAASLIVLDHHSTAQKKLEGLPFVLFDMGRSGAAITWDFFFPGKDRPMLIQYAQDHDLWKFELPDSKAVTSALEVYPKTIGVYEELSTRLVEDFETLKNEGVGAMLFRERLVEDFCARAIELEIEGNNVLGVECPRDFRNEVAGALAEGRLFGVAWQTKKDGTRAYSLRVRGSGFPVNGVAEKFGGGGHSDSAAFAMTLPVGSLDPFQVKDPPMLEALNTGHVPAGKG